MRPRRAPGPGVVPVRDSKAPKRSALVFPEACWASFIDELKAADRA
ncbi:DUF397 domain-containing protein [Streptomyces lunaelactis]|nr:DUF397 domain-containing protein [Streptomyces lunaelactis]NUK53889.1 DUF397 domain-containing protein [Streptomyces lunaelactis]NUK68387.1 DUF397 domain-containing protein [Streptomyces lunaelactis]